MGKKHNKKLVQYPPNIPKQEDYDLKQNFSRLNRYRSSNNDQTTLNVVKDQQNASINSSYADRFDSLPTNQLDGSYFKLYERISDLSDKNNTAINDLRKELEGKIDNAKNAVEQQIQDIKDTRKWKIGAIIAIIGMIIGYIVLPYQKSSQNQRDIIEIKSSIDKTIIPYVDKNTKDIEKNSSEINNYREKIYQIQLEQQNLNSIIKTLETTKANVNRNK